MNNTYEKPLFNSFSHMLFIAFVSFNGFFYLSSSISVFYIPSVFIITIFILNRNDFSIFPLSLFQLSFPLSSHIFCYILPVNAPLPFPAWIMISLSDQLLIRRFLLGNVYLDGGVPGGYSDRSKPFSSIHFISLWCSLG